uniref:Zinc finger CCCH domain-containing protein 14 n=1 Tax=Steinernema glaseri TaxID=37863 RepID=A0A1I7YIS5_9BILA
MTATAKDAEKQKRKVDGNLTVTIERKPLSERLSRADGSRCSVEEKEKETTPPVQTWNYQIELSDNESDSEDEAMIDAVVADTSGDEKGHSSSQEDHMQPEERAFFVRTAVNKVHFNPAHPSFANKDGSVNQEAIQEVAPMVVSANSAPQAGPPCTKYQTRCRFWPNCNQSDEICPYAHPSIPCTKFPHCRFGDRCLYVHPICRYGMLCRNTYCGYLHPTKTSNLTYMKPVADTSQPMAT